MTYRCGRCEDTGYVWEGTGGQDDPREEVPCPVCVTGQEEPEWEETEW